MSAAVLATGCSGEDDFIASAEQLQAEANAEVTLVDSDAIEQPILIGMPMAKVSVTRGTGTVGGFDDDTDNKWESQHIKVFMLDKGTMNLTRFSDRYNQPIYENADFWTPGLPATGAFAGVTGAGVATSGIARPVDNRVKFYPPRGNSDFFAYRVDSCETGAPYLLHDNENDVDTAWVVDFKIDGSQDIMTGKATATDADITALENAIPGASDELKAINRNRAFSAFAARHGVQPTLKFKHNLSRLTFQVVPLLDKSVDAKEGILVDSISVASYSEGTLTIAHINDVQGDMQQIKWNREIDRVTLYLKQRKYADDDPARPALADSLNLVKLSSFDLRGKTKDQRYDVGEALLVAPDTMYKVRIHLSQNVNEYYDDDVNLKSQDIWLDDYITLPGIQQFAQGTSYNVVISIFGLKDIKITATLAEWENGGEINLRPEDENEVPVMEP